MESEEIRAAVGRVQHRQLTYAMATGILASGVALPGIQLAFGNPPSLIHALIVGGSAKISSGVRRHNNESTVADLALALEESEMALAHRIASAGTLMVQNSARSTLYAALVQTALVSPAGFDSYISDRIIRHNDNPFTDRVRFARQICSAIAQAQEFGISNRARMVITELRFACELMGTRSLPSFRRGNKDAWKQHALNGLTLSDLL